MAYVRSGNPQLRINLKKLRHNIDVVTSKCREEGIELAGVIKGCTGLIPCVKQFEDAGVRFIASSRIEQLAEIKESGVKTDLMMIRIPMLSEAAEIVKYCEYSLNSEIVVLEELNRQAKIQDKVHKVILMADCGDLREGWWDKDELCEAAIKVERELTNLHLEGVGFNVGCYGSIIPTPDKIQELVGIAEKIEKAIGRELEFISGGASSSYMRILDGNIPERVNMLRIGENILLAYDLQELYGYDLSNMYQDVFTLRAEIIELKDKPSHPVGEIGYDAFGNKVQYVDRGIRKRALLALGKCDYGSPDELLPRLEGIEILGASSDHTILDVQDAFDSGVEFKIGDVIEFDLNYATMVYLTNTKSIDIVYE
ncbi:MAG: alanine/ornithine racemase family PLP-dependent enzyme [Bacillota bacterium]|nr:alanine/ornithine racemase family PLP-dependent enzyme [Bacillota bacterium]